MSDSTARLRVVNEEFVADEQPVDTDLSPDVRVEEPTADYAIMVSMAETNARIANAYDQLAAALTHLDTMSELLVGGALTILEKRGFKAEMHTDSSDKKVRIKMEHKDQSVRAAIEVIKEFLKANRITAFVFEYIVAHKFSIIEIKMDHRLPVKPY